MMFEVQVFYRLPNDDHGSRTYFVRASSPKAASAALFDYFLKFDRANPGRRPSWRRAANITPSEIPDMIIEKSPGLSAYLVVDSKR